MRRALPLLLLALLAPAGAAQVQPNYGEKVEVTAAEFPPVVLVERPFYINVTLRNKEAAEQRLTVFATLYEGRSDVPCEGARAIQSLSKFQKSVVLAAGETRRIEGEPDHWAQVVNGSRVTAEGAYEVCVWVRLAQCPREADLSACFLDFHQLQQAIRLANTAPRATIAGPARGSVGQALAFSAQGEDDEGDPLRYAWAFGDGGTAQGAQVSHTFRRAGTYTVVLNVTDPFGWSEARARVEVVPAGTSTGNGLPGFEAALLAGALALTAAARRVVRGSR